MSQKDPNNVSGLLKMHLREHRLLSDESAAMIQTVIAPDMVSGEGGRILYLVINTDLVRCLSLHILSVLYTPHRD